MAVSIIPGYDFGVNEVPNRETLLRQAKNVKISGIGLDQIDATLVGIKSGPDSGTTSASLPAPGWLWADPGGSCWLETDHGPVKLKRAGGGFETRRWAQTFAPQTPVPRSGHAYTADPVNAAAQQTEGISLSAGNSEAIGMWDERFVDAADGPNNHSLLWSSETTATGDTYPRLVGRGLTLMHTQGSASPADYCVRAPAGVRAASTNQHWSGAFVTTASNILAGSSRETFFGVFVAPHSGTSFSLSGSRIDLEADCFGWKYDQAVQGPGDAL
jgi:hypothetical protein